MFNNARFMFPGTISLLTRFSCLSYPRKLTLIYSQASVVVHLPLYLPTNEEGV